MQNVIRVAVKKTLRALFAPLLNVFEQGDEPFAYKSSHRTITIAVGSLFLMLSVALLIVGMTVGETAVAIPGVVFFAVAVVAYVVAFLGSDRAVAKLWGSRR